MSMTLSLARLAEAERVKDAAEALIGARAEYRRLHAIYFVNGSYRGRPPRDWEEAADLSGRLTESWPDVVSAKSLLTWLPDLIALVQALGTLGPEIEKYLAKPLYERHWDRDTEAVLRQVQALIPKGE